MDSDGEFLLRVIATRFSNKEIKKRLGEYEQAHKGQLEAMDFIYWDILKEEAEKRKHCD